ncbi:Uncharacterized protein pbN1_30020 [Aromatoleum bremense]|nr:Uncharacterized protein pbN1_30020 [Aromatoleum bremense]
MRCAHAYSLYVDSFRLTQLCTENLRLAAWGITSQAGAPQGRRMQMMLLPHSGYQLWCKILAHSFRRQDFPVRPPFRGTRFAPPKRKKPPRLRRLFRYTPLPGRTDRRAAR